MADLTVSRAVRTGNGIATPTPQALTDLNNTFVNDGVTTLRCVATGTVTVTVRGQKNQPLDGVSTDQSCAMTSGDDRVFGPWPVQYYNNLSRRCELVVTSGVAADVDIAPISSRDDHN